MDGGGDVGGGAMESGVVAGRELYVQCIGGDVGAGDVIVRDSTSRLRVAHQSREWARVLVRLIHELPNAGETLLNFPSRRIERCNIR